MSFETLSKQQLNAMTSDEYKQNFEGQHGDDFRKRVSELENAPRAATRPRGSVRGDEQPVQPAAFDPSFDSDEPAPAPAPAAVEPVPAPAATDESLPELVHEYQPLDANGRPIGGKQSFRYRTKDELIEKLTKAHSAASTRIRTLSRDRKLEQITTAGETPRVQPEKEVPNTVEGLAAELRAQRESNFVLSVRAALSEFQASVDWAKYRSNENAESVVLAVGRAGDDPTDPAAYQRAFNNMKEFLQPVVPATAEVPAPAPAPVVAAAPAPARTAQRVGISTGLSSADQFSSEAPIEVVPQNNAPKFYTAGELDRMPSEQMKKLLRNPVTAKRIDAVYQEAAARRGGR